MSSLYKLSIEGIRSFDVERAETIQFGFPLTLICGQNGCGKTTVIECLKYATTGDLPPNSKGGAFLNDPNIANRNVVTGQIKLAFKSVSDKSMIIQRTMQLTKKRGRGGTSTNTFKTLEGQLSVISRGVKSTIGSKNAELDTDVPMYLGASRAILDYVIFCHQDDSLWPLSEASVLKKRFDEIFEALKFTKVLDNLKTIRKDLAVEIKLIEQSVQHLKIDKGRAKKISDRLHENEQNIEEYTKEIADITVEIEKYEKEAAELFESNQHYQETLSEHERLKLTLDNLNQNLSRLSLSIKVLNDSDEELSHRLAHFTDIENEKQTQIRDFESTVKNLTKDLDQVQSQLNKCTRLEGSFSNKRQIHQNNLSKLKEYETTAHETYGIELKSGSALLLLKQYAEDFQKSLSKQQKEKRQLLDTIQQQHDDIKNSVYRERQHITYCDEDIESAQLKIKVSKKKLNQLLNDENTLELEKSELDSLQKKFEAKKQSTNLNDLDVQIENQNSELSKLEFEVEEITKKITSSNKQSDLHTRLALQTENKESKQESIERLLASKKEAFKAETGKELSLETANSDLNKAIEGTNEEIEKAQILYHLSNGKIASATANIESYESRLQKNESSLVNHKSKILEVLEEDEIEEYEKIVGELEEDHSTTLHNLNTFDVTKNFKIKAIELAKMEKCCTLCKRSFENDAALQNFTKILQESVDSMSVTKLQENVEGTRVELEKARSINSDVIEYRKLLIEDKEIKTKMCEKSLEVDELQKENNTIKNLMEDLKTKLDSLNALKNTANNLTRLTEEVKDIEKQINNVQNELKDYGASAIPLAELQKLQQVKNFEIKNLRSKINEDVEFKYAQQKELTRLDIEIKDKTLSISNLEMALSEITSIKTSINDFELHIANLRDKKTKSEVALEDLDNKFNDIKAELGEASNNFEDWQREQNRIVVSLDNFAKKFQELNEEVQHHIREVEPEIEENLAALQKSRKDFERINQKRESFNEKIKEMQNEINESVSIERNIRDNIEFRQTEKEIDNINEKIGELDIKNAEIQKQNYQKKSQKIRGILSELNSEHAGKIGEIKQIRDQVKNLRDELETEFKDVDDAYQEEWVKLQSNLLVSNDLLTYSKALDNAIMKYHSAKMEDINRILRELWNATYKGSDIDSIEIKSDVNLQAKGNRSYNYRVVMYKSNIELDMRGRCSAGQKVLTSILIRLALAECFGANCGMIALDEPTTNLDLDNSESLAIALNRIIQLRKDQKNFQLIVITHDEKFLSHINGDSFTDHFYRLQRDEHQKSIIRSLPIAYIHND